MHRLSDKGLLTKHGIEGSFIKVLIKFSGIIKYPLSRNGS